MVKITITIISIIPTNIVTIILLITVAIHRYLPLLFLPFSLRRVPLPPPLFPPLIFLLSSLFSSPLSASCFTLITLLSPFVHTRLSSYSSLSSLSLFSIHLSGISPFNPFFTLPPVPLPSPPPTTTTWREEGPKKKMRPTAAGVRKGGDPPPCFDKR